MKSGYFIASTFVLFALFNAEAFAQNQDAVAKAQYMLRQLNAEKVALEKENTDLKRKLQEIESKSAAETEQTSKQNKNQSSKIRELESVHARLAQELQQARSANGQMQTQYGSALQLCMDNNRKLYEVNLELLVKYKNKGLWKVVTQAEPVTGLSRVELENVLQDFQYRIEDLKIESAGNGGDVPAPGVESLTSGTMQNGTVSAVP